MTSVAVETPTIRAFLSRRQLAAAALELDSIRAPRWHGGYRGVSWSA
jgi:hypothetical protein